MQPNVPQDNKSIRSQLRHSLQVLYRHPFVKLSALLLAIVFWAAVIASDPTLPMEKIIPNAQVSVQGLEALRNRGYTIMTDLSSNPIFVKMRVEVAKSNYEKATAESIAPRLELSQQIDGPGRYKLKFSTTSSMVNTISFEPEYIEIDVEAYTPRKLVSITAKQVGETEEPLWANAVTIDPTQLVLSGPKSLVDKVRRAVATLDLSSLSADLLNESMTLPFELQDADGNVINSPLLRTTSDGAAINSVIVSVNALPTREIPVSVESAVRGVPQHGYMLSGVDITPSSVTVAAPQEVLDSLKEMHVSAPISITGANESKIDTLTLRGFSGVSHLSVSEVTVEAKIVPAEHVHTYGNLDVTVMGLAPDLDAKLSRNQMCAVISGLYKDVESLKAEDIHLYIDATGLGEGTHTVDVQCRVDGTSAYSVELEMPQLLLSLAATGPLR